MLDLRLLGCALLFSCFNASSIAADAPNEDPPDWFYPTCQRDFKIADSFADECLKNARVQTRYFNGAPETHSYYFWSGNGTDSHFGMGCMVGATGQIMYLGMYYTTHPANWAVANTAKLRYIDFQGNVGLTVNGEPVNLLTVRQFKTDKIPARYSTRQDRPKGGSDTNCEFHSGKVNDWILPDNMDAITLSEVKSDNNQDSIRWCFESNDKYCKAYEYTVLSGKNFGTIFYHGLAEWEFIREDGSYLYNTDDLNVLCDQQHYARRLNFPTLAYELCPGKAK